MLFGGSTRSWLSVGGDSQCLRSWNAQSDARAVFTSDPDWVLTGCFNTLNHVFQSQSALYAELLSAQRQLSGYVKFNWTIQLRPTDAHGLFERMYREAHVHIFDAFLSYMVQEKGLLGGSGHGATVFWPGEPAPVLLSSIVAPTSSARVPSLNHLCLCEYYFGRGWAGGPAGRSGPGRALGQWVSR